MKTKLNLRKIVSLLLALIMCVSILGTAAFAAAEEEPLTGTPEAPANSEVPANPEASANPEVPTEPEAPVEQSSEKGIDLENLVEKTAEALEGTDDLYEITLKVPGQDGTEIHDEIILMVDGSYSGDDEWNSMMETIISIGETVLNGNGNTQLTLMAFGMGDNVVLQNVKDVDTLKGALGELPGTLLYGRSSTNCEAGFTGVQEYIENYNKENGELNEAHVLFISDGEINTDEHLSNFYDWKNNGWHRFSEELIIGANFEAELEAIENGANRSDAFKKIFGENTDLDEIYSSATFEQLDEYNKAIWENVYAYAGLDPNGEHTVSDVERAFVKYDEDHGTYNQDNFYYALIGRTYPNRTDRTKLAAEALADNDKVESLYLIDNNKTTEWMQTVGNADATDNTEFVAAGSVANILPAIESALTDLSMTPYNDVVVTDYMSKWVDLDTDTIHIVDNTTGEDIYTTEKGWLIEEALRPTSKENPVIVELVDPSLYADGGPDVIGNTNGDIYKLTWYVKDGALLRSENYSLKYVVAVDTEEAGYVHGTDYPANGTTEVSFTDEFGKNVVAAVLVPTVETEAPPIVIPFIPPVIPPVLPNIPTPTPSVEPTPEVSPEPSAEPSPEVTPEPTEEPAPEVTPEPVPVEEPTDIADEDVPLAEPVEAPVEIVDEEVPLTEIADEEVPKTGDVSTIFAAAFAASGLGLGALSIKRKKNDEE